jgi:hypothetical protein
MFGGQRGATVLQYRVPNRAFESDSVQERDIGKVLRRPCVRVALSHLPSFYNVY